jgi:hypothetical protein
MRQPVDFCVAIRWVAVGSVATLLLACGGGGGDASPAGDTVVNNSPPGTGLVRGPEPSSNNTLKLTPAPTFKPSSLQVRYQDCFPAYNDMRVGDVLTFNTANAGSMTQTTQEVANFQVNGRAASKVTLRENAFLGWTGLKETIGLTQGAITKVEEVSYDFFGGASYTNTYNYTQLGDLSSGRTSTVYTPGDTATHKYARTRVAGGSTTIDSFDEVWTFLGVEENLSTPAGKFAYACVFRLAETAYGNGTVSPVVSHSDYYFSLKSHKPLQRVRYATGSTQPLVDQLAADTGIQRR